MNKTEEKLQN